MVSQPKPPRCLPGPPGIRNQRIALHQQRIFGFQLLARGIVRVAVIDADGARHAVLAPLRAPAAAQGPHMGEEEFPVPGIDAVHQRHAKVCMMACDHRIRNRIDQRLEHRIDDRHRKGHPPAHRCGPRRRHHAARRHDGLQIPERAVIDRVIGRRGQAFERHLRAGMARGDAGIVEAAHLFRDVGQIDGHLVAFDLDADLDRNGRADTHAIIVHEGLRFVDSVGNGARAGACGFLDWSMMAAIAPNTCARP